MRRLPLFACLLAAASLAAAAPPATLSLSEAIARGRDAAAPVRQADENIALAESLSDSGRAALLPQLKAEAFESRRTVNLKAQGIEFPGAPDKVGPFNTFDARLLLSQSVLDMSNLYTARGASLEPEIARAQKLVAEEQSASRVTLGYIEVLRSQQAVAAAASDYEVAQALLVLAQDRRKAGVASGVDVTRAEAAVAQDKFALARARAALESALIRLKRKVAVPQDAALVLSDGLDATAGGLPPLASALDTARQQRAERSVLLSRIHQLELGASAARSRRLPTLGVYADYGSSANTPTRNDELTYTVGARLSLPLISGGAISAGVSAADARLNQARIELDELEARIEEDVRVSLANAASADQQVEAARSALDLAGRELSMARNRFAQGVVSNVEVVEAQSSLTHAKSGWVEARAAFQLTRADLAAALGRARDFHLPPAAAVSSMESAP